MNLQSIDLNLLVAFESLMEERNVTRAAKRIGLSQPAMSNALARLRRTFNDPLLVRAADAMMPTSAAQALIIPVRAALAQLRAALEQKPAFAPAASTRAFQLLTNDYAEIMLIAPLIKTLREAAKAISLKVHRSANVFQPPTPNSLADSSSIASGFFPDTLSLDASLHSQLLWEEKNVCIASASHPSIKGKLSLRQYAAASHVAVFYKSEGPGVIDTLLAQKGLSRNIAAQVPHFSTVPFLVACSDLIATLPERFALEFSKRLKLQTLPAPIIIPPFRLTMLWHDRAHHDHAHEWMRGLIARTAARLNR
jgi:DNA-binding transcriptional LysR family regulator